MNVLLMLAVSSASAASPPLDAQGDPATAVKAAIDRDWVARVTERGDVQVTSPIYAMPYGQGCVIHRLYFLGDGTRPSLGHMVVNDQYFVFASGDACATVDPGRFFSIEPGNDVSSLLDFARRLQGGPRPGKDRVSGGSLDQASRCFTPEAMATTNVRSAISWRPEGGRRDQYKVALTCASLKDQEELVATGSRGDDAIAWKVGVPEYLTVGDGGQ
jgi:hypothetical protein